MVRNLTCFQMQSGGNDSATKDIMTLWWLACSNFVHVPTFFPYRYTHFIPSTLYCTGSVKEESEVMNITVGNKVEGITGQNNIFVTNLI